MSICKSCGAEIKWIKLTSGKAHPVDVHQNYYIEPYKRMPATEDAVIWSIS